MADSLLLPLSVTDYSSALHQLVRQLDKHYGQLMKNNTVTLGHSLLVLDLDLDFDLSLSSMVAVVLPFDLYVSCLFTCRYYANSNHSYHAVLISSG